MKELHLGKSKVSPMQREDGSCECGFKGISSLIGPFLTGSTTSPLINYPIRDGGIEVIDPTDAAMNDL